MAMQEFFTTYPGNFGDIVETITLPQKVTFRSWRAGFATLTCCPRRMYFTVESELNQIGDGSAVARRIGSSTAEFFSVDNRGEGTTAIKYGCSQLHIRQYDSGCAGEALRLKLCFQVNDFSCTPTAQIARSCTSLSSYVDFTAATA